MRFDKLIISSYLQIVLSFVLVTCTFIMFYSCKNRQQEKTGNVDFLANRESLLTAFVVSVPSLPQNIASQRLDSILLTAETDSSIFHTTVNYLEKPFGDPNSIYRNENLNARILEAKINSKWYDNTTKTDLRSKWALLLQNKVGNKANDFTYITASGYKKKMYDLKAEYTLLFFYNPQCDACKSMKTALMASTVISGAWSGSRLNVLAIYTDLDENIWIRHLRDLPEKWINGRDENEYLYKHKIYDLRAIPTIYLLDRNKRVILKDCMSVSDIEKILSIKNGSFSHQ